MAVCRKSGDTSSALILCYQAVVRSKMRANRAQLAGFDDLPRPQVAVTWTSSGEAVGSPLSDRGVRTVHGGGCLPRPAGRRGADERCFPRKDELAVAIAPAHLAHWDRKENSNAVQTLELT